MSLPLVSHFNDFLKNIRLTENQVSELKSAHETLRSRLEDDEELKSIIVGTFLQGSYKRSTAVRPQNGNRSDVDIIIVTNLDKESVTPDEALDKFKSFLERYYKGKYRKQGRSWGIEMSHVDLDVVPTSAPSEMEGQSTGNQFIKSDFTVESLNNLLGSEERSSINRSIIEAFSLFQKSNDNVAWKEEPLYIPDREAEIWEKTHPLEQIRWTIEKNSNCNGHYINVVKALKWWRKIKFPDVKNPKSYPLEHFIGDCCPDGILSVAEGIVLTLEKIVTRHIYKPFLSDRGVPEHDVFARVSDEEYEIFYKDVKGIATIAREAFDSTDIVFAVNKWREIFGYDFPEPPKSSSSSNFTPRAQDSGNLTGGRFA
jgi:predicted nucleotidyltransferase